MMNECLNGVGMGLWATVETTTWADGLNHRVCGNELWRFGVVVIILVLALIVGRVGCFLIAKAAHRLKPSAPLTGLFLGCLARPSVLAVMAVGVYISRFVMLFDEATALSGRAYHSWDKVSQSLFALAAAYLMYRMVDIIEYYLTLWNSKSAHNLDVMLVSSIRKILRVVVAVVAVLFIGDNILELKLGTLLATAGIGGLALALAAQETVANFFGSVNIFADQPFQVGDCVRTGGVEGTVEAVGFRSTRIRTANGHLVNIPNSSITKDSVENITRRPAIKKVLQLTVTYGTSVAQMKRAVAVIKEILAAIPQVNTDPSLLPRVHFSEFKDWALNIQVVYWVMPPDHWLAMDLAEQVHLAILDAFAQEGIEFAFPTQTLYVKKD